MATLSQWQTAPVPTAQTDPKSKTAKPTKPLLKHTSVTAGKTRKRSEVSMDSDSLTDGPTPAKKARVSFNPKVEEKTMEAYSSKGRSIEGVKAEVRNAIEALHRGDATKYDAIKDVFADKDEADEDEETDDRAAIGTYLVALTSHISLLDRKCSGLVKAILGCEWLGRDEAFVRSYIRFLGHLASAHGQSVGMVLGMLVEHYAGVRLSSGRLRGYGDVSRETMFSRVHMALKYLLGLIPSGSGTMSVILSNKYPSSVDSKKIHITYINNLVRTMDYAPELKSDIFALITEGLIKIDVQMQLDLDDDDDEIVAGVLNAISMSSARETDDDGEDSDSDADSVASDEDASSHLKRVKEVQESVEKMDAIIDLLFTVYNPYFSDPYSVEAASMFETLLRQFQNTILPNYRSRHTQFLLFHFAQTAEHLVDQFAGTCVQLALHDFRPAVLRESSVAYLASFVSRGAHVEAHVVRTVFELIGSHLDDIRTGREAACRGPDLQRYGIFYAMTQALLYIFCFRWRDLLADPDIFDDDDPVAFLLQDLDWVPGVRECLTRAIYSKLNPLKVCSPSIVAEFAKIAHHLRFLYVFPLLETNKRIRLGQFSAGPLSGALRDTGNGGNKESWHQLDAYFPFDPFQLPVSKRWLEGDYIPWTACPGLDRDEEVAVDGESSEDEEESEEEEDEEEDTATDEASSQ